MTAPSLEALCLMRSIARPLVRERHTRSARPFALRARGRRVFGSALPYAKQTPAFGAGKAYAKRRAFRAPRLWPARFWKRFALCEALLFLWCAHGARTAKLRAHGPKAKRRLSIGEEPSGSGRLRARRMLSLWRGPPKAPRQWQSRWIAHAPRANRFAVRAPCAHPRQSIGKALGKALPKTGRPQARRVKGPRFP